MVVVVVVLLLCVCLCLPFRKVPRLSVLVPRRLIPNSKQFLNCLAEIRCVYQSSKETELGRSTELSWLF